jgi:hypothetical protein
MTISLDELQRRIGEDLQRERDAKRTLVDPFKRKRSEPGKALVRHGKVGPRNPSTSLGGKHS